MCGSDISASSHCMTFSVTGLCNHETRCSYLEPGNFTRGKMDCKDCHLCDGLRRGRGVIDLGWCLIGHVQDLCQQDIPCGS